MKNNWISEEVRRKHTWIKKNHGRNFIIIKLPVKFNMLLKTRVSLNKNKSEYKNNEKFKGKNIQNK